jgi:hypothetical protein
LASDDHGIHIIVASSPQHDLFDLFKSMICPLHGVKQLMMALQPTIPAVYPAVMDDKPIESYATAPVPEANEAGHVEHHWYRGTLFNVFLVGLISFSQPGLWAALNSEPQFSDSSSSYSHVNRHGSGWTAGAVPRKRS